MGPIKLYLKGFYILIFQNFGRWHRLSIKCMFGPYIKPLSEKFSVLILGPFNFTMYGLGKLFLFFKSITGSRYHYSRLEWFCDILNS